MDVSVAFSLAGIKVNFDLFWTYFRHMDSICDRECVAVRFASNIAHRLSQTIKNIKDEEKIRIEQAIKNILTSR